MHPEPQEVAEFRRLRGVGICVVEEARRLKPYYNRWDLDFGEMIVMTAYRLEQLRTQVQEHHPEYIWAVL